MKKILLVLFLGVCLFWSTAYPSHALLFSDDFTGYTVGGNLAGQGGWLKGGTGVDNKIANTTSLTYSTYNGGGGNYVTLPTYSAATSRLYHDFSDTSYLLISPGTVVYASFLINLSTTSLATSGYFFSLGTAPGTTNYYAKLEAQQITSTTYNLGVSKTSNTVNFATGKTLNTGTTYVVVIRYNVNNNQPTGQSGNTCYMWINPSLSTEPDTGTADAKVWAGQSDFTASSPLHYNIGSVMWHSRGATNPVGSVDGIRVAASSSLSSEAWADLNAYVAGASITIVGGLTPFSQTSATPTAAQTYVLKGSGLVNNIVVTPPTGFEISSNGGTSWVNSSSNITYSAAQINGAGQTISVRLNASTLGGYNGNISHSGADITTQPQPVVGTYTNMVYSHSTGNLELPGTWNTNSDGSSGSYLGAFAPGYIYVIQNRSAATIGATWTIDPISTGSKVVVGDGTNPCAFTVPSSFNVSGTIDVSASGTLNWGYTTTPSLGTLSATSTVNFNQSSGTFTVPANTYGNLTLTNATKIFSSGTFTVAGNLLFDGATNCNGSGSPFTTINLYGNYTFTNGATFDSAQANRLTLVCTGSTKQTLTGGGNEIYLFRLTINNTAGVVLSNASGSNITVGNFSSGGISFGQTGDSLIVNGNRVTFYANGNGYISGTGTFTVGPNAEFVIQDGTPSTLGIGTLTLTNPSQSIKNLTLNLASPATAAQVLTLGSAVTVSNSLTLTAGYLTTTTVNLLTLGPSASITGGSATSYVIGPMARTVGTTSPVSYAYPIGLGTSAAPIYRPLTLGVTQSAATPTVYTATPQAGANLSVSPLAGTLNSKSAVRYYTIGKGAGATVTAANITLSYSTDDLVGSNNAALRIARDNGSVWEDLGGTGSAPTTGTITSTVNFTSFGDFILAFNGGRTLNLTAFLEGYTNTGGTAMNFAPSVTVELHNSTAPYALVESQAGSLSTAGIGTFNFTTAANGVPYYIAVKTWNTVETWSAIPQSFTANTLSYNFTTASTQSYLSNMTQIGGAGWCIYSGDVNQDGYVNLGDYNAVNNDSYNQVTGVVVTDVTGDQFTNLADYNIVNNNSYNQVKMHSPLVNPLASSVTKPILRKTIKRNINNN